ncbi:hypothetical protein C5167_007789, partial [Papaver somniferum]
SNPIPETVEAKRDAWHQIGEKIYGHVRFGGGDLELATTCHLFRNGNGFPYTLSPILKFLRYCYDFVVALCIYKDFAYPSLSSQQKGRSSQELPSEPNLDEVAPGLLSGETCSPEVVVKDPVVVKKNIMFLALLHVVREHILAGFNLKAADIFESVFDFYFFVKLISGAFYPLSKEEQQAGIWRHCTYFLFCMRGTKKIQMNGNDLYLHIAHSKLVLDVKDRDGDSRNVKMRTSGHMKMKVCPKVCAPLYTNV